MPIVTSDQDALDRIAVGQSEEDYLLLAAEIMCEALQPPQSQARGVRPES